MRKILYLLLAMTLFGTTAQAKHENGCMMQGGFYDANAATMTVADVRELPKDTFVQLKGKIVKRVGKDMYEFTDGKDNIMVEIDNKIWRNQTVSPKDMVILYGEVDKEKDMTTIDVKSLNLIHP